MSDLWHENQYFKQVTERLIAAEQTTKGLQERAPRTNSTRKQSLTVWEVVGSPFEGSVLMSPGVPSSVK